MKLVMYEKESAWEAWDNLDEHKKVAFHGTSWRIGYRATIEGIIAKQEKKIIPLRPGEIR